MFSRLETTHLYTEIFEQPHVINKLGEHNATAFNAIQRAFEQQEIQHILVAARGSSDNAGLYAKYLFGAHNKQVVSLATPSIFTIYQSPPDLKRSMVLAISQSGQSPDIAQVVQEARRQGGLTVAICNDTRSPIAQSADFILDIHAGAEQSIAATKTYTAQLTLIAMLSNVIRGQDALEVLEHLSQAVGVVLQTAPKIKEIAANFWAMRHIAVIGRGYNYATAFEIALKLKELTYTMAAAYSSADFVHGPLALIEPGFPIILIAPEGKVQTNLLDFVQTTQDLGAKLIVIGNDAEILSRSNYPIDLAVSIPEWLSPITMVIPGQLFAMHLASLRGINPDHPRTIHKVTKTV